MARANDDLLPQSPAHALGNYPGRDLKVNYEEDILVGYRWFDTKKIMPQFPFGYGLSYTSEPRASVLRPAKELKAFEKVFLQPGETKTVTLNVKAADLAFYDESKKDWNVQAGDFILQLGNSSGNVSQTMKITVK